MELQVGVKVLLKNKVGKYLLVRRSSKMYPEVGATWDLVGGRIDVGTPLKENLKREVKEEIGLTLKKEPTIVAAQDILKVSGRHVVRLTYLGEIEGEPTLNEENTEFRWFTSKELALEDSLDVFLKEVLEQKRFDL